MPSQPDAADPDRRRSLFEAVGFRVFREQGLETAKQYFDQIGIKSEWIERDFEDHSLHVVGNSDVPHELCARMDDREQRDFDFQLHRGVAALRLDHFQYAVPDVTAAAQFCADIGFRTSSDFVDSRFDNRVVGIFMHCKNNPNDAVFTTWFGPRLHHAAFIASDAFSLFKACDIAFNLGLGHAIEYGPSHHNQWAGLFLYLRDPDAHRIEMLLAPVQMIDIDYEPKRWEESQRWDWSPPPPKSWIDEASPFPGVPLVEPTIRQPPKALEEVRCAS